MATTANYGLRALIAHSRFCPCLGRECKIDPLEKRETANKFLDPSHQVDEATYNAVSRELARDPDFGSPKGGASGGKQRVDGKFERLAEVAFKAFRDEEREFLLNVPAGPLRHDNSTNTKWWNAALHLRHHLEFLLVLKGVKPCVLFLRDSEDRHPTFSTVIIDVLVPIMDRLDLWSYGFRLSFMCGDWVFYDCRSPLMPQIGKIFLTHPLYKLSHTTDIYTEPEDVATYLVPELEVAQALGYPIRSKGSRRGLFISIRDETEMQVLIRRDRHQHICCVQGMGFRGPEHGTEADWIKVLTFYHKCEKAALAVGTMLCLCVEHPDMVAWLERNPGWLVGPAAEFGMSGPRLREISYALEYKDGGS